MILRRGSVRKVLNEEGVLILMNKERERRKGNGGKSRKQKGDCSMEYRRT